MACSGCSVGKHTPQAAMLTVEIGLVSTKWPAVPVQRSPTLSPNPSLAQRAATVASGALAEATKSNVAVSSPFPPRRGGKGVGGIGGDGS